MQVERRSPRQQSQPPCRKIKICPRTSILRGSQCVPTTRIILDLNKILTSKICYWCYHCFLHGSRSKWLILGSLGRFVSNTVAQLPRECAFFPSSCSNHTTSLRSREFTMGCTASRIRTSNSLAEAVATRKSSFQYEPLPPNHIRLLSVSGEDATGGIEFALEVKEINDELVFYALSYVWGSSDTNKSIVCNGQCLLVTQSVHDVLSGFQKIKTLEWMPLWIDAICINQQDYTEKEREVARMDIIYRQAKCVLIWLGKSSDNSDLAMGQIETLALRLAKPKALYLGVEELPQHGLPPSDDSVWTAISHLYDREWFRRLWTFQEAALATSAQVVCGSQTVSWSRFCQLAIELVRRGLSYLGTPDQYRPSSKAGFHTVSNIDIAQRLNISHDHLPFYHLIRWSHSKHCVDPRDRVYALLSLTSPEFRSKIVVSYNVDPARLYIQVVKASLEEKCALKPLQMVADREKLPGLPSWCVNLNSPYKMLLGFGSHLSAGILYCDSYADACVDMTPDENTIKIEGFRADGIARIVPPSGLPRLKSPLEHTTQLLAWSNDCLQVAYEALREKHHSDNDIFLAHTYTITSNTKQRASDSHALQQAYRDIESAIDSRCPGNAGSVPFVVPQDRLRLYYDTQTQMNRICKNRAYFTTTSGRLGVGPPEMLPGDLIAVFFGGRPAFVLREIPGSNAFTFIGDAFVHGLMELSSTPAELIQRETFILA
jgi:hypothetical protein